MPPPLTPFLPALPARLLCLILLPLIRRPPCDNRLNDEMFTFKRQNRDTISDELTFPTPLIILILSAALACARPTLPPCLSSYL